MLRLAFSTSVRSSPAANSTTPLSAKLIGTMPPTVGVITSIGDTLFTPWLPSVLWSDGAVVVGEVVIGPVWFPKFGSLDGLIDSAKLTVPAACNCIRTFVLVDFGLISLIVRLSLSSGKSSDSP